MDSAYTASELTSILEKTASFEKMIEFSNRADADTFWYNGDIYKKKGIYKGWLRIGEEWVIDEQT